MGRSVRFCDFLKENRSRGTVNLKIFACGAQDCSKHIEFSCVLEKTLPEGRRICLEENILGRTSLFDRVWVKILQCVDLLFLDI